MRVGVWVEVGMRVEVRALGCRMRVGLRVPGSAAARAAHRRRGCWRGRRHPPRAGAPPEARARRCGP
eukprot:4075096-Prymnesium_polylepis.1